MGDGKREPLAILGGSSDEGGCSCGCCAPADEAREEDAGSVQE